MNRAEGHNNTENSSTNTTLNWMLGLFFTPSTPIFVAPSDEERAHINQIAPDFLERLSQTLDQIHNDFLDPEFITPPDLTDLKKDYINCIA